MTIYSFFFFFYFLTLWHCGVNYSQLQTGSSREYLLPVYQTVVVIVIVISSSYHFISYSNGKPPGNMLSAHSLTIPTGP